MIDILICGDPSDHTLTEALLPALAARGGVCFSGEEHVAEQGTVARYFVCESEVVPKISVPAGILLFKDHMCSQQPTGVPDGFFCVMDSGNRQAADVLRGSKAAVITCGTGSKDTLSIASLEPERAEVSLQRNLKTLGGTVLEPHDFSVLLSRPLAPGLILLVSAVLLLSDVSLGDGFKL